MRGIWLVFVVAACTKELDTSDEPDVGTDPDTSTDTDPDTDPVVAGDDEDRVRALLAGQQALPDVFAAVSDSGGWPVRTSSGTVLFVAEHDGDALSVAGDFDAWVGTPMTAGDGFWWAEIAVAAGAGQTYKFTDGAAYWADPWARHYTFDGFGEISLVQPGPESHYGRFRDVTDGDLAPRTVRVRVPAAGGPWPVLYVQDGQNLFEGSGAFGSWHLDQATGADRVLIVGVDSTSDRISEYTHAPDAIGGTVYQPLGDAYADLVTDVVRPRVESTWPTNGLNGVMGSSLGGLISLHIAQRDPAAWDYVASLSGTLGWGRFEQNETTMQDQYVGRSDLGDLVVYVDSGGDDGGDGCVDVNGDGSFADDVNDSDNFCTNRGFADALAEDGFVWDSTLFHWHEPGAPHNEAAWAARVNLPLGHFLDLDE